MHEDLEWKVLGIPAPPPPSLRLTSYLLKVFYRSSYDKLSYYDDDVVFVIILEISNGYSVTFASVLTVL